MLLKWINAAVYFKLRGSYYLKILAKGKNSKWKVSAEPLGIEYLHLWNGYYVCSAVDTKLFLQYLPKQFSFKKDCRCFSLTLETAAIYTKLLKILYFLIRNPEWSWIGFKIAFFTWDPEWYIIYNKTLGLRNANSHLAQPHWQTNKIISVGTCLVIQTQSLASNFMGQKKWFSCPLPCGIDIFQLFQTVISPVQLVLDCSFWTQTIYMVPVKTILALADSIFFFGRGSTCLKCFVLALIFHFNSCC